MTTRPRLVDRRQESLLEQCSRLVSAMKAKPERRMSVFCTAYSIQLLPESAVSEVLKTGMGWRLVGTYDGKAEADMLFADLMATLEG